MAATEARADIVVTRYSSPDDYPTGISISSGFVDENFSTSTTFAYTKDNNNKPVGYFSRGGDYVFSFAGSAGYYVTGLGGAPLLLAGAEGSSANYVSIDFGGDGVYEAVGQFDFATAGSGALVALALDNNGATLSISAGKAAIDAAAVPEPSGLLLGLLALGAAGCRRRRVAVPPRQVS